MPRSSPKTNGPVADQHVKTMKNEFRHLGCSDVNQEWVDAVNASRSTLETVDKPVTIESQREYICAIERDPGKKIYGLFMDGTLVGTCGVQLPGTLPDVGYLVFPPYRGQGYATEMIRRAAEIYRCCMSTADVGNVPALRAALSAGAWACRSGRHWIWIIFDEKIRIGKKHINEIHLKGLTELEESMARIKKSLQI